MADKEYCRWCPGHTEEDAEYLGKDIKRRERSVSTDNGKRNARGAGAAVNPSAKPVRTVKFRFSEGGALTYVSHLDIARAVTRGLIKSKLPIYYTEGFNPIPKLTFASPLSVGSGGENELAQFKLCEDVPDDVMLEALKRSMPDGIDVLEVYSSDSSFKQIAWAENVIDIHCDADESVVPALYAKFAGAVVVTKKTKSMEKEVDISPFIRDFSAEKTEWGVRVRVTTCADNTNYLNPEYVAKVAAEIADPDGVGYHTVTRQHFLFEDGRYFR